MKKWIVCLLVFVLALGLAACAETVGEQVSTTASGYPGDVMNTAFYSFTVDAYRLTADAPEPQQTAPEGKHYLYVTLTVSNTGAEEMWLYYDEFELYYDGGRRFPEFPAKDGDLAEDTLIAAGQSMTGEWVFLVPQDAGELMLLCDEYYQGDQKGESYAVILPEGGTST